MISIHEAKRRNWQRMRIIARRHRTLPWSDKWFMLQYDAIVGLDLDEVLQGPEVVPA